MTPPVLVAVYRVLALVCHQHQHLIAHIPVVFLADRLHHFGVLKQVMLHIHQRRCSVDHHFHRKIAFGSEAGKMVQRHLGRYRQPLQAHPRVSLGGQCVVDVEARIANQLITGAAVSPHSTQIRDKQTVDRQAFAVNQQLVVLVEMQLRHHARQRQDQLRLSLDPGQLQDVTLRERTVGLVDVAGQIQMLHPLLKRGSGLSHVIDANRNPCGIRRAFRPKLRRQPFLQLKDTVLRELPLRRRCAEHLARAVEFAGAFIAPVDVAQPRLAERISGREIALTVLIQQLGVHFPLKADRIVDIPVQCVAVAVHDHRDEVLIAHPALDFE
ncbi:hypothetical protein D3C71_1320880 [compost metagenome]